MEDTAQVKVNFTEDEIQTIKHLINDWGFDYGLIADRDKVVALAEKLETQHGCG